MRLLASTLMASVIVLAACDVTEPPALSAERLEVVTNAPALTTPGHSIETISVRLVTSTGVPVPGRHVAWSGDGELVPVSALTDDNGIASARWNLPRVEQDPEFPNGPSGVHEASASAAGVPSARFTITTRAFTADLIDADSDYACAITSAELWCWGAQLLPFGLEPTEIPVAVALPGGVVPTAVRTSFWSTCTLSQSGAVLCTGFASPGTFAIVAGIPPLRDLVDGDWGTEGNFCGRAVADDTAWCWTLSQNASSVPAQVSELRFASLAVGDGHWCGVTAAGAAWCWGANDQGQLGTGTKGVAATDPQEVIGAPALVSISAGNRTTCGASAGGEIWCWGVIYPVPNQSSSIPVRISLPGITGTDVHVGGAGEGYVIANGVLRSWFRNALTPPFVATAHRQVLRVTGDGQACVQMQSTEIFCSWILMFGGGDSSPLPGELVPVPDPAAGH